MASKKVRVDFTGVESFQRPSEGQHVVKIVSAELKQSQGGNDMIVVAFEVTKGQDKGARVFENYPLAENALWKLKGMLQAIGMKCDGKVQLDLDKLIGKVCIVEVIDDEYNGQIRSRVQECRKLAAVADDEDDEDDDIDDDEDEDDEEEDTPKKKAPAKKEKSKPTSKKKAPMNPPEDEDDEDDDEDWDDDDEEEEEEPAPKNKTTKKAAPAKKTPAKKTPAKKTAKKSEPEDDDEDEDDEDWDEE